MPLHPVAKQLLDDAAASDQPNCHLLPVAEARANFEAMFAALGVEEVHAARDLVADTRGADIPVRLYSPTSAAGVPLVLYLHGGGWQMGSVDSHDGICRAIANTTGFAVLSVNYRRPPEYKFPVAPRDCYAALVWALENADDLGIDPTRVAVVGDSAGGNLAAAVALQARDNGGPRIACQVLIYPATTFDVERGFDLEYEGFVLFRDEFLWHKEAYFAEEEDATHRYASPLDTDLEALPPTLVITAEYDPIATAGRLIAEKLPTAGVKTEYRQYPGMIHGFIQFPGLFDEATEAVADLASFVRTHVAGVAR